MTDDETKKHECRCGYRCGGPGRCKLDILECLGKTDGKHYVRDCDHDFQSGPWVNLADGGGSSSCACGLTACSHDMRVGP